MTFVVTDGVLRGMSWTSVIGAGRVDITDTLSQDYATIWRTQPQVRTVIGFLSRNVAQLNIHVYERVGDTDRRRVADHPMTRMIANPNPWTTRYRWLDALMHDRGIYDNAVLLKTGTATDPRLVRLPIDAMTPLGDNWLSANGYRLYGRNGIKDFDASQVVHFRGYNPVDQRWGVSPMETLRQMLIEEYEANRARQAMWRNGARFSGVIERPLAAKNWSPEARQRFREDWRGLYTGDGPGVGGTPVLEDGMRFVPGGMTPEQAQYLETRKLTREEVAAAFHIPPPFVGILDHATFSNITEQHKNLYQDTLGPWLVDIVGDLMLQLLRDVDPNPDIYLEFNLAEKLRGTFEEQATVIQTMVGAPIMTRNEGRARVNLPSIDGGDQLVTPLNVLVGGQPSPTAPPKVRGPVEAKSRVDQSYVDKGEQVMAEFFRKQAQVITSRVGAKTTTKSVDDVFDTQRWDADLAGVLAAYNVLVSTDAGGKMLEQLGVDRTEWDTDRTLSWLRENASGTASGINASTKASLAAALSTDDALQSVKDLFGLYAEIRAPQIAKTQATAMSGFGTIEALHQQNRDGTKTWVTGPSPRPSHAAMAGETVPYIELFSNGARWPADSLLPEDDRAGCNCEIVINVAPPED